MKNLDDALEALADARRLAADLATALDTAESAVREVQAEHEFQQVAALARAMKPSTPPLVGDYVPAEWTGEGAAK